MNLSDLIAGLYGVLGIGMIWLTTVRWRNGFYIGAVATSLWASMVWRIGIRYATMYGHHDFWALSRWSANMTLIAVQVFALCVATLLLVLLERDIER